MAAKRRPDRRRPAAAADATTSKLERPGPRKTFSSAGLRLPVVVAVLFFLALAARLSIYISGRRPGFRTSNQPAHPESIASVHERGLVKAEISFREILEENTRISLNQSDCQRHFLKPVLAYVTPWNSKGYDMAKLFSSKFTHVSPVWYELKSEGMKVILDGQHNFDSGWINEIHRNGNSLIVPRVVLEAHPTKMLLSKKEQSRAIDLIVNECKDMGYDGIVLESWSRWAMYGILHEPELRNLALEFVKHLGEALHSISLMLDTPRHLELIYVIPPVRSDKLTTYDFGAEDFRQLANYVDGFSLMTYDFSGPQNPGPNAPLWWIQYSLNVLLGDKGSASSIHSQKIFLGVNFYGNDYLISGGSRNGRAILGRDFTALLEEKKPRLQWDERSSEHYFTYSDGEGNHLVFYPSLLSISVRLDEAREWDTGIAIWEIGQGLNYFFDLL